MRAWRRAALLVLAPLLVAGCMNGGILRAPLPSRAPTPTPAPSPIASADPQPIVFPRDEAPHGRLTEWWYYTGHLDAADGREFGFEFVIFRAERGDLPVAWASHLALTDAAGGRFLYDQRGEAGPQVDGSPPGGGFALVVGDPKAGSSPGGSPSLPAGGAGAPSPVPVPVPWAMEGREGRDHLSATERRGAFAFDLSLTTDRPPVLHGGVGWIDFGPAGGSYYYSRTRMLIEGSLALDGGDPLAVTGIAWFDHQWGDFIAVGAGGWDWFSLQLADGSDLTTYLVRGPRGESLLAFGTLVAPDGSFRNLPAEAFTVEPTGSWRSPHSGAEYPSGWRVTIPGAGLDLRLDPLLADQELDTRATSGVVYWEGAVAVSGTAGGAPATGRGYVELTGYARVAPPAP